MQRSLSAHGRDDGGVASGGGSSGCDDDGGGCAGFSYGFSFVEEIAEDDTVITKQGVSLVVDAMSLQYLEGSEVDYREGLQGSQFLVNNPNATTTCGCGSSFSL